MAWFITALSPCITCHFRAIRTSRCAQNSWLTPLWLWLTKPSSDVDSIGQCNRQIISIFVGHNLSMWSIYCSIVIDGKYSSTGVLDQPRYSARSLRDFGHAPCRPASWLINGRKPGVAKRREDEGSGQVTVIKTFHYWSL